MKNNRIKIPESAYIHENELNQFIHIQIPMELVVADCFANISGDAKILYGLLLNRTGLSIRSGWKDDNERTFIYYTIEDVMTDLHISHSKASRLFSELSNIMEMGKDHAGKTVWFGLIEKVRVLNKPSRIYVHKVSEVKALLERVEKEPDFTGENAAENAELQVSSQSGRRSSQEWDISHHKNETTDVSNTGQRSSQIWDGNNNYLINNNQSNTEGSNNHSFHSLPDCISGKTQTEEDVMEQIALTRELIRENVNYDVLILNRYVSKQQVDELIEIMVETCVLMKDVDIGDMTIPHELIRSRFEKYNMFTMESVLASLSNITTDVKCVKKYLLAVLYNAPLTMDNQVRFQVQHDMSSDTWRNGAGASG